jgi:hypothetical protein
VIGGQEIILPAVAGIVEQPAGTHVNVGAGDKLHMRGGGSGIVHGSVGGVANLVLAELPDTGRGSSTGLPEIDNPEQGPDVRHVGDHEVHAAQVRVADRPVKLDLDVGGTPGDSARPEAAAAVAAGVGVGAVYLAVIVVDIQSRVGRQPESGEVQPQGRGIHRLHHGAPGRAPGMRREYTARGGCGSQGKPVRAEATQIDLVRDRFDDSNALAQLPWRTGESPVGLVAEPCRFLGCQLHRDGRFLQWQLLRPQLVVQGPLVLCPDCRVVTVGNLSAFGFFDWGR